MNFQFKISNLKFPILIVIIILAAILRLWQLDKIPKGFTGDEAQQGYSGYSILKTGKDEWGQTLPIFPRGFGDYKPPIYTYLTIPSEAIFGLNIFSVRLPAAIIGTLSVAAVYLLVLELLGEESIALWSALLLAISPWSIQISRTAFEGGIGVLTFSLALLFFLKGNSFLENKKSTIYWLLSALFFGLTLYTYHSWRVFTGLFILGIVYYFKKIPVKKIIWPGLILVIFVLPLLLNLNLVLSRSTDVSIFSSGQLSGYFDSKIGNTWPPIIDKLVDNKVFFIGNQFLGNFLSYFSPSFYFTGSRSDGTYLNFPNFPLLYPIEILFWVAAMYLLIKGKVKNQRTIVLWLLLAVIPASLATGGGNANRTPTLLPLVAIISAIGLDYLVKKVKVLKVVFGILLIFSFLVFLHFYLITLPQKPPDNLRIGYQETFENVIKASNNYNNVVVSKAFTEPQIFIAFYSQMDPSYFQKASQDWLRYESSGKHYVDQLPSWNMGNYLFEDINWVNKDSLRENALVVSKASDFPDGVSSITDIKDNKGNTLYRLVPTR